MKVSLMIGMALGCTVSVLPVHWTAPAKAEWAGGQAAEQVGQNGRHAKAPKQHHGCHGGAEQDNNECQGIMHKRVGFPKIQTTSVAARSWQARTVS